MSRKLQKRHTVAPRQQRQRWITVLGSIALVCGVGCTSTRPTSSSVAPELAESRDHSAESTAASTPMSTPAPTAPVAPQPQRTEPVQNAVVVAKPAAKATTSPTTKAATPTPKSTAKAEPANAKNAVIAAAPVAPATPVTKPPSVTTSVATAPQKTAAPSTLDMKALEQRLRDTPAIGVFTKLSLKNQVDDLLDEFRAYYSGKVKTQLAELRQRYDLLLMKVLTLLQDSDAALASTIIASREPLWDILKDPKKFATI